MPKRLGNCIHCTFNSKICFVLYMILSIIFKQIYGTLMDIITPGQSGPKSNSNEGVLCTPQTSRTRTSSLNAVSL